MLDYTHKQYIDENLTSDERAIYFEPRFQVGTFSSGTNIITIADNKNENRRFLIIRSFVFSISETATTQTATVVSNKTGVLFNISTGPSKGNFVVDANLIFPGGSLVITVGTDQVSTALLYQIVSVSKKINK